MPQLKSSKQTSIRKPLGSRPGERGFRGIRAETKAEGFRRRLVPTTVFEKGQEALGVGAGPSTEIDIGGQLHKLPIPLAMGVGKQNFSMNSPTFRLLKFMKTIRRAAGKARFTVSDKAVLRKMIKQGERLEKRIGKIDSRRQIKFLDPNRGSRPPSNFDLPNLKTIGELKKMSQSTEFRGKIDVVRRKLLRPAIESQKGKPIRDIEQRSAGTGKPSDLPAFSRAAKLKARAARVKRAVMKSFGKRKKK